MTDDNRLIGDGRETIYLKLDEKKQWPYHNSTHTIAGPLIVLSPNGLAVIHLAVWWDAWAGFRNRHQHPHLLFAPEDAILTIPEIILEILHFHAEFIIDWHDVYFVRMLQRIRGELWPFMVLGLKCKNLYVQAGFTYNVNASDVFSIRFCKHV